MDVPPDQRLGLLIIDDDAISLRLASGLLRRAFPELRVHVCDGTNPYGSIARYGPSLVVTDLYMPGYDGLAIVGELRRTHPDLPVVVMTAQGSEEAAVNALRAGAASYVPKQRLSDELIETVRWVLAARSQRIRHEEAFDYLMSMERYFELPSRSELISPVVGELQSDLRRLEVCPEEDLVRVGVALTETLMNAMIHGNLGLPGKLMEQGHAKFRAMVDERLKVKPYCDRRVRLWVKANRRRAEFVISDEGEGFVPDELPDPTDPEMILRPHGRGLLLIRTFMDEVRFNATGNEVTLVKQCKAEGENFACPK